MAVEPSKHESIMHCTECLAYPAGQERTAGEPDRHRQDAVPAVRHAGMAGVCQGLAQGEPHPWRMRDHRTAARPSIAAWKRSHVDCILSKSGPYAQPRSIVGLHAPQAAPQRHDQLTPRTHAAQAEAARLAGGAKGQHGTVEPSLKHPSWAQQVRAGLAGLRAEDPAAVPTVIYASRTHSQLKQVMGELEGTTYRRAALKP